MINPVLADLAARFLAGAQADAQSLERALSTGDFSQIEQTAHSIAGAAGIFGLTDIGAAALTVDDCFARGDLPSRNQVEALIARIRDHS